MRLEQSNLDRRIKSAVLVDPGLAQAYDAQSLNEIAIPMNFINLGSGGTIPAAVIASGLAALSPHGSYATIAVRARRCSTAAASSCNTATDSSQPMQPSVTDCP